MSRLVIRADDLGISKGVNYGIYTGLKEGFIRTVGLMVNQEDAMHGYGLVKDYEYISLGLHCNIVLGRPVSDPDQVPSLVCDNGSFRPSRYYRSVNKDTILYEDVCREIRSQVLAFQNLTGRLPDYVDYHAACTPTFTRALEDVCQKMQLLYIPYPSGKVGSYEVKYCTLSTGDTPDTSPTAFYERNRDVILGNDLSIAVFHPGYVDARIMQVSSLNMQRMVDLEFVTRKECRNWLSNHGVEIVNFDSIR